MRLSLRSLTAIAMSGALAVVLAPDTVAASARHTTPAYRLIDLGTLGGDSSYATAVNDHGVVVGSSSVADGSFHGFRWRKGKLLDLGTLRPVDINNKGWIAGNVDKPTGTHAALWRNGKRTGLGTLGGAQTFATAMNDKGQVVGVSDTRAGQSRPFLWSKGRMRTLPLDTVSGINNRGEVAGGKSRGTGFHAVVWRKGKVIDLGALAFDRSNTYGINNRGWVIGWAFSPSQDERGILWKRNRTLTDIGTLGGDATHLIAINDRGRILGVSDGAGGLSHPFLWSRGAFTDLTTLGVPADGDVVDMNDRGEIVGAIRPIFGTSHAVIYRPC